MATNMENGFVLPPPQNPSTAAGHLYSIIYRQIREHGSAAKLSSDIVYQIGLVSSHPSHICSR